MKFHGLLIPLFVAQLINASSCLVRETESRFRCLPTPIYSAQTLSSGNYIVCQNIIGDLVINASDVALNLNSHTITGSITIESALNQVAIKNGVVDGSSKDAGIMVDAGATNITIDSVRIMGAARGIYFNTVSDSEVAYCSLMQNTTGIELESCSGVYVHNSGAVSSMQAGFSLVLSSTCYIEGCKALNTGENNTAIIENNVYGFAADQCYGTVFKNCIANATQALSTTDQSSVVVGFALLGTGTQCNAIIGCEAASASVSMQGLTPSYGIYLQSTLLVDNTFTVTVDQNVSAQSLSWSPDGLYFATGGLTFSSGRSTFKIYKFDFATQLVTLEAEAFESVLTSQSRCWWHPFGPYIAVVNSTNGSTPTIHVARYDGTGAIVSRSTEITVSSVGNMGAAWSKDGNFLAIVGSLGSQDLIVARFNSAALDLVEIAGDSGSVIGNSAIAVDFRPDNKFLAVGKQGDSPFFRIVEFQSAQTFTQVDSDGSSGEVYACKWSPNGKYIAAGGDSGLVVYLWENGALSSIATDSTLAEYRSVEWSSDGRYIFTGGGIGTSQALVYEFNPGLSRLKVVRTIGQTSGDRMDSVSVSPDGQYVGIAPSNVRVELYEAFEFPLKNIIINNTVYCNSTRLDADASIGTGISGSSIANFMIQNTSYNNPFNYVFVTNVFNDCFGQFPSDVQNIGLVANDPIKDHKDCAVIALRTQVLIESLDDLINALP